MKWITWKIAGWLHAANSIGTTILWKLTLVEVAGWIALLSFLCAIYCWYTHGEEHEEES